MWIFEPTEKTELTCISVMGGVGSKAVKPLKNWNIESRAHKVISQVKPKAAPTYNTTQKQIELVDELEPDYKKNALQKNEQLDDNLKRVYVTSDNAEQEIDTRYDPDRPLPKDRYVPERFEYGFYESKVVKAGQISLRQSLDLISNHKNDPEKYTVENLANEYKLDKEVVENILTHFRLFNVYRKKEDNNLDVIASHIPLSVNSGIQVRYTEKDDTEKTVEDYEQDFLKVREHKPLEEEKKKIT